MGNEKSLYKEFYQMEKNVETLFAYYENRIANKEKNRKEKVDGNYLIKQKNEGEPPKPSSPYSS